METIHSIPRRNAVDLIEKNLNYTPRTEWISLGEAYGRVVSEDILSRTNLPNIKSSRWDGIAFNFNHFIESNNELSKWQENIDFVFSNTGIGIFMENFDTMVKIEDTSFENGQLIRINQDNVIKGQNVIPVGERMSVGDVLVAKDTRIKASQLNLMASGGVTILPVYEPPRVSIIPTGNELVPHNSIMSSGMTIESNSFSMSAKVRARGGETIIYPILPDDMELIKKTVLEASMVSDLIVLSGGSGRGQHDLLQKTIGEIGSIFFTDVEHGPGKRTSFSVVNKVPVFGLVGPPGGEEMTFDFYVLPAIDACLHQKHTIRKVNVILDDDIPPHNRVSFYYTLKVYKSADGYHAKVLPHAAIDRNIAEYNGYIFVPKPSEGYCKGDLAEAELRVFYDNI